MKIDIGGERFEYDANPDHCPTCHHAIEPLKIGTNLVERDKNKGDIFEIIFRCPRRKCQFSFIAVYRQKHNYEYRRPDGNFYLKYLTPNTPERSNVDKEIADLSPNYVSILSQSASAEAWITQTLLTEKYLSEM